MSIGLIDTSVFCNIVPIPGMDNQRNEVMAKFREYVLENCTLLLPMATIIETGNHIAHYGNGNQRRRTAEKFINLLQGAFQNRPPWTIPQPLFSEEDLSSYLNDFPASAMQGISLGDLSIIKEFEHQCELHPQRLIFIWALDEYLSAYRREAAIWATG
jgi:hypothetical protein